MPARAMWKGKIKIGTTRVPVALYSAVIDRTLHFHILEEKTMTPVKQHMVNPATGKQVPTDEISNGMTVRTISARMATPPLTFRSPRRLRKKKRSGSPDG